MHVTLADFHPCLTVFFLSVVGIRQKTPKSRHFYATEEGQQDISNVWREYGKNTSVICLICPTPRKEK